MEISDSSPISKTPLENVFDNTICHSTKLPMFSIKEIPNSSVMSQSSIRNTAQSFRQTLW